ncbi:alpha/beta fold hydrolase [Spirillospora sp. NPDC048911]|uniref:alpha/beta fold hydrolase n=1 Tax=Spirillospora sp. NPDC048911 TaxID=3364527 RepID=UPI003714E54B
MTGIHAASFGEGPPVLALHGINGHGGRWRKLAEHHLSDHRVLAPDLRGHGRSTYDAPWHVGRHVADLLALLDAEDISRTDVVGHSYGGMIAVYLARTAPERVRRLVLLDPAVGLDPAHARVRAHEPFAKPSFATPDEALTARMKDWPNAYPGAAEEEVTDHLQQDEDGRWRFRFEPAAVVTAFSEMARPPLPPPPGVPTHLVIATRADIVQPAFVVTCRETLGDDLTITEMDAGHMLYLDRFDETGALIRTWLTGV